MHSLLPQPVNLDLLVICQPWLIPSDIPSWWTPLVINHGGIFTVNKDEILQCFCPVYLQYSRMNLCVPLLPGSILVPPYFSLMPYFIKLQSHKSNKHCRSTVQLPISFLNSFLSESESCQMCLLPLLNQRKGLTTACDWIISTLEPLHHSFFVILS